MRDKFLIQPFSELLRDAGGKDSPTGKKVYEVLHEIIFKKHAASESGTEKGPLEFGREQVESGLKNLWKEVENAYKSLNGKLGTRGNAEIKGSAPYVQGQGMIVHGKQVTGAMITGIDPQLDSNVSRLSTHLQDASLSDLKPGEFGILLGSDLANYLAVDVGEKITVITPEATVTPAGIIPKFRRFTVLGTYTVGMPQYDRNTASIHIDDAKRLFHLGDAVTGLRLKFEDLFDAQEITYKLRDQLGGTYWVSDWTYHNRNFFRALKMEEKAMLKKQNLASHDSIKS